MNRFDSYLATILDQAGQEARQDGSTTVEAHHILLAIAAEPETSTQQVLTSVGLDYPAIRAALDREFERSLAAAGSRLPPPTCRGRAAFPRVPRSRERR